MAKEKMEYFKNGEVVKLKNNYGEDFDVKIVQLVRDYYGDMQMYYVVEPIGFVGFQRTVKCELCYR